MSRAVILDLPELWRKMEYHPNPIQKRIHGSYARHRVNAAGRRAGKSVGGGRELTPKAIEAYFNRRELEELDIRMECWIVGPNYTDSEKEFRVFYNDCRKRRMPFDKPGTYYNPKGDMSISLWDHRFIVHAKSGAHPESLVGEGLHFVLMAEAAKMKESVWQRFVRPMLADFDGTSLWNSTPEGKNWFYDIWKQGKDPMYEDWSSWRHPSWLNRHVFKKHTSQAGVDELLRMLREEEYDPQAAKHLPVDPEIVAMALDLTEAAFQQEVACSFSEQAGRVFKRWDEEVHVGDYSYNINWPLYLATDYGYTDPNVCLFIQVDPHQNVFVIAEYYETQRTDEEFRDDVLRDQRLGSLVRKARALYPDPADPGATRTLSDGWQVPSIGGTGGSAKNRRDAIIKALEIPTSLQHLPYGHPERVPKLRFDRSCRGAIRDMAAWVWPEKRLANKRSDEPKDEDNHGPEALGRFYGGHYGLTGTVTQTSAAVRRGPAPVGRRRR